MKMEKQLENLKKYMTTTDKKQMDRRNTKFITISSGKGGVGKTNFIVNFAYILANNYKKRVLLVDADIGLGNVHIILRLPLIKSLKEVLNGASITDNIITIKNFDVLPGFSGFEKIKEVEQTKIDKLLYDIENLSSQYDYILIDTSAGIGEDVISFIVASDKSYIITTPEPTAITDAYALIKTMVKLYDYNNFEIIVNMCKNQEEGFEIFLNLNNSTQKFLSTKIELAGVLPFSENLRKSVLERKLIAEEYTRDTYTKGIVDIVEREINNRQINTGSKFWEKFLSFFKMK